VHVTASGCRVTRPGTASSPTTTARLARAHRDAALRSCDSRCSRGLRRWAHRARDGALVRLDAGRYHPDGPLEHHPVRRVALVLALIAPILLAAPGCKLANRNRVQSINRMNEGIKLFQKKNASGAEKALKESIELDPTHAKAHFSLGQLYRQQGKLVDAEKAFRGAIDNMKDAPNADYWYEVGAVLVEQAAADGTAQVEREKKWADAIVAFNEAIKIKPNHYRAYYRVGTLHEKLDQPQQADAAFRKSIEIKSSYSPAFVSLGNMYIDYGHANVAMAVLDTGAKVNDKDARMWNGLGRAFLGLNQSKEAIEAFQKAKAIDPDMPDVLFGLGMAYAEQRKRKEAIEHLQQFLAKAGADVPEDTKKAANDTMARMQDVI
jgi:tetratricopeptide (TPR) repeat protein